MGREDKKCRHSGWHGGECGVFRRGQSFSDTKQRTALLLLAVAVAKQQREDKKNSKVSKRQAKQSKTILKLCPDVVMARDDAE